MDTKLEELKALLDTFRGCDASAVCAFLPYESSYKKMSKRTARFYRLINELMLVMRDDGRPYYIFEEDEDA